MPWKVEGLVLLGTPEAEFIASCKDLTGDTLPLNGSIGRAYKKDESPFVIWIARHDDVATLAHEALHIVFGIMEIRGLKLSDASEEAFNYTLEDILRQSLRVDWRQL